MKHACQGGRHPAVPAVATKETDLKGNQMAAAEESAKLSAHEPPRALEAVMMRAMRLRHREA